MAEYRSRILVVTVVHRPDDSRIRYRQISTLLDAGWQVTYAAPFSGYGQPMPGRRGGLTHVDIPQSSGRRRWRSLRAARALLEQDGPRHDVVLLHDPELLTVLSGLLSRLPPVVWDVHEDTAAAVTMKPWLPALLRPATKAAFRLVERWAERNVHLILAEHAYQSRFRHRHLVVPNVNRVPTTVALPDQPRVIYVGSLTSARGALDLVEVARIVTTKTDGAITLTLVGHASPEVEGPLHAAVADGVLEWSGFLPSDQAMARVCGAMAGLSLLRDEPNYRVSLPTKVVEYMAHGVPVMTTPLPLAQTLIEEAGCGVVVPFGDPAAAAEAVLELWADPRRRARLGAMGHRAAREHYNWTTHATSFVAELTHIAGSQRSP